MLLLYNYTYPMYILPKTFNLTINGLNHSDCITSRNAFSDVDDLIHMLMFAHVFIKIPP